MGSYVFVWKLGNTFAPGDIIAHRHSDQIWVSRVVRIEGDTFILQRNQWPEEKLPRKDVIGKVVSVYWRASPELRTAVLKRFTSSNATISKAAQPDGDAWRVDSSKPQVVRLFEVPVTDLDDCTLTYRAKLKTENIQGRAFLEMWCHMPGGGEYFSRGLDKTLTGSNDWATYEIPFFLRKGDKPDLLKLNLNIEGTGKVWIKDIEVSAHGAGVKAPPPTSAAQTKKTALTDPGPGILDLDKPPQLRFLQIYDNDDHGDGPVHDVKGRLVGLAADVQAVHASGSNTISHTSQSSDDVFARLWFEHRSWDEKSLLNVEITLPDGSEIPGRTSSFAGPSWSQGQERPPALSIACGVGKLGHLPEAVRVKIRYTVGPWTEAAQAARQLPRQRSPGREHTARQPRHQQPGQDLHQLDALAWHPVRCRCHAEERRQSGVERS